MKLIYHPASPFSRKVYMLALELGLADQIVLEKVVVAPIPYPGWSDNNADVVAAGNPLAKIPTLVVDELGGAGPFALFDSAVICEFLLERAGVGSEAVAARDVWVGKSMHACADGMMDAEVLVVYEERIRAERWIRSQVWIDGQREKVQRGFDFLERMAGEGRLRTGLAQQEVASVAELAVAAAVGMFEARGVEWRKGRGELGRWFDGWKERESYIKTKGRGW